VHIVKKIFVRLRDTLSRKRVCVKNQFRGRTPQFSPHFALNSLPIKLILSTFLGIKPGPESFASPDGDQHGNWKPPGGNRLH